MCYANLSDLLVLLERFNPGCISLLIRLHQNFIKTVFAANVYAFAKSHTMNIVSWIDRIDGNERLHTATKCCFASPPLILSLEFWFCLQLYKQCQKRLKRDCVKRSCLHCFVKKIVHIDLTLFTLNKQLILNLSTKGKKILTSTAKTRLIIFIQIIKTILNNNIF